MCAEQQAYEPPAQKRRAEHDQPRRQDLDPDGKRNVPECSSGSGLKQPNGRRGNEETSDNSAECDSQVVPDVAARAYTDRYADLLPIPEGRLPPLIRLEEISHQR